MEFYFYTMSNFLDYKNNKIHYSDVGNGSAVVLLHGFLEDISMWNNLQKILKATNRVICIDLLGHGKTDCFSDVSSMEDMAATIKFVLEDLKINSATFIGHSMGGYVALAFTEAFPEIVNGLCLMNSTTKEDSEERKKNRIRAIKMAKTNYEALVSMSINNLFGAETRSKFLPLIEESKRIALQVSSKAYIACSEGMRIRKNRMHVLSAAKFKTLIIAGKKDAVLSHTSIVDEAKKTNTSLESFSNGHMSHIENPLELATVIKNFIAK